MEKKKRVLTLHHAVNSGNLDKLRQLLKKGAEINAKDIHGDTALHVAVVNADIDCARLLILEGADVNLKCRDDATPLHLAASLNLGEFISLLISNEANVNARGCDAVTPLHFAVSESNVECATLLLRYGACVNATTKSGKTPLHIAVTRSKDCIEMLVNGNANIFAKDCFGTAPLDIASELGVRFLKKLLPKKCNVSCTDGTTALHIASRCVNSDCLKYMIRNGCDVNIENIEGDTPLHFACMTNFCHNFLQIPVNLVQSRSIEFLIKAGANVQKKNKSGLAPIHFSIKFGHLLSLKYLHQFGADLNFRGGDKDFTPLHFAAEDGNLEGLEFLIENKAEKEAVDADGCTALMIAAKNSQFSCVKFLLELDVPLWTTKKKKENSLSSFP